MRKNLHKFLLKEFDDLYPTSYGIIAHPFPAQGDDDPTCVQERNNTSSSGRIFTELDSLRLNRRRHNSIGATGISSDGDGGSSSSSSSSSSNSGSGSGSGDQIVSSSWAGEEERVVVAIGPEGGWEEEEVRQFEDKGFKRTQLGSRILRTDIAVYAGLL